MAAGFLFVRISVCLVLKYTPILKRLQILTNRKIKTADTFDIVIKYYVTIVEMSGWSKNTFWISRIRKIDILLLKCKIITQDLHYQEIKLLIYVWLLEPKHCIFIVVFNLLSQ